MQGRQDVDHDRYRVSQGDASGHPGTDGKCIGHSLGIAPWRHGHDARRLDEHTESGRHARVYVGPQPSNSSIDGRRAPVRQLRVHHGAQRHVLQVHELRELNGMQLNELKEF